MSKNKKISSKVRRNQERKLNTNELSLQPWFLPNRIQHAIRVLVPYNFRHKMRHYFDDYGCMVCGYYQDYAANGMCRYCHTTVTRRLNQSARRRLKSRREQTAVFDMLREVTIAKKLLGGFSPKHRQRSDRRRPAAIRSLNPVLEA